MCTFYFFRPMTVTQKKLWQVCLHLLAWWICPQLTNTKSLSIISWILQWTQWTYIHVTTHEGIHYADVIMGPIASQITSLTTVYSIVYSDADQRKHQSSASLAFVWGIHRDRWTPRTKGQLRGKCFHLMTSSCGELTSASLPSVTLPNQELLASTFQISHCYSLWIPWHKCVISNP